MGSIRRRLASLEEVYADVVAPEDADEEQIRSEARSRMSVPELRAYVAALRRACESGSVFAEEDRPVLERVALLKEEVRDELVSSA